jgi:hypothetical protein
VALEPPLSGYEEVKPRLLEMKALSQEGLGMVSRVDFFKLIGIYRYPDKSPKNYYVQSSRRYRGHYCPHGLHVVCLFGTLQLNFTVFYPCQFCSVIRWLPPCGTFRRVHRSFSCSGELVHFLVMSEAFHWLSCRGTFSSSFFLLCVIHVPCQQAQYIITTLILGFPTWISLRKRIQAARIDSVMKVE